MLHLPGAGGPGAGPQEDLARGGHVLGSAGEAHEVHKDERTLRRFRFVATCFRTILSSGKFGRTADLCKEGKAVFELRMCG